MTDKILLVDDNESILFNTKVMLEMNGYEVIIAEDGKKALKALEKMLDPPAIIISDIMMPEMGGYTFYKEVSKHKEWCLIPFIFLTAKSSEDDIRFGKKLGVDDYITKPFEEEDLIAVIHGKISKNKLKLKYKEKYENKLKTMQKYIKEETSEAFNELYIFMVEWDEVMGPKLTRCYPDCDKSLIDLAQIGCQLFDVSSALYGREYFISPEGTLINLRNIKRDAFIYFNVVKDKRVRGGNRLYMLVAIT
ncbi:MAG: response regulator, partial [Candidatus Lokiarchaeota archaeon]|nr:response regulator [Candidatus Lokiarchaeota archaeon]